MGKNKGGGKKLNVFKVAGAKSLKAKSKAKPVTGNLKKINEIIRKNIEKIDTNLVTLNKDIRQKPEVKEKPHSNQNKKGNVSQNTTDFDKETVEKLNNIQF